MKVSIAAEAKYCMTVEEAAAYFNVGIKRLISLLESPEGAITYNKFRKFNSGAARS